MVAKKESCLWGCDKLPVVAGKENKKRMVACGGKEIKLPVKLWRIACGGKQDKIYGLPVVAKKKKNKLLNCLSWQRKKVACEAVSDLTDAKRKIDG